MFVVNSGVGYTGNNNPIFKFIPYYTAFSPRSIRNCSLWLDGNDPAGTGVQPANSSTVTIWVDKSGSGYSTNLGSGVFYDKYQNGNGSIYISNDFGKKINFKGNKQPTLCQEKSTTLH